MQTWDDWDDDDEKPPQMPFERFLLWLVVGFLIWLNIALACAPR